jgi:hypothetical protein
MFKKSSLEKSSVIQYVTKNSGQTNVWDVRQHSLIELPEAASSGTMGPSGRRDESIQGFACSYDKH